MSVNFMEYLDDFTLSIDIIRLVYFLNIDIGKFSDLKFAAKLLHLDIYANNWLNNLHLHVLRGITSVETERDFSMLIRALIIALQDNIEIPKKHLRPVLLILKNRFNAESFEKKMEEKFIQKTLDYFFNTLTEAKITYLPNPDTISRYDISDGMNLEHKISILRILYQEWFNENIEKFISGNRRAREIGSVLHTHFPPNISQLIADYTIDNDNAILNDANLLSIGYKELPHDPTVFQFRRSRKTRGTMRRSR